jgi:hypothetical protein
MNMAVVNRTTSVQAVDWCWGPPCGWRAPSRPPRPRPCEPWPR